MSKRKCKQCGTRNPAEEMFIRSSVMAFCNHECAIQYAQANQEKGRAKLKVYQKKEHRAAKERIKSRSDWMKEAQAVFNKFIRLRDAKEPCICCGRNHGSDIQWHAGHFLTTGARPEHRFNEDNCHKQTSYCNNHLSGNVAEYRKRLVLKIGLARVEAMESDHNPKKYTIEQLKEIKAHYRKLNRELS